LRLIQLDARRRLHPDVATGKTAQGIATLLTVADRVVVGLGRDRKDRSGNCDLSWKGSFLNSACLASASRPERPLRELRHGRTRCAMNSCSNVVATGKTAQGIATETLCLQAQARRTRRSGSRPERPLRELRLLDDVVGRLPDAHLHGSRPERPLRELRLLPPVLCANRSIHSLMSRPERPLRELRLLAGTLTMPPPWGLLALVATGKTAQGIATLR